MEKKSIHDGHFIGSVYELEYIIRREYLGKGKNFGRIRIKTVYQTLTYEIMASKGKKLQVNVASYEKRRCLEASRDLLRMRMGKLPVDQWSARTKELLADMKDKGYYSAECQLLKPMRQSRISVLMRPGSFWILWRIIKEWRKRRSWRELFFISVNWPAGAFFPERKCWRGSVSSIREEMTVSASGNDL